MYDKIVKDMEKNMEKTVEAFKEKLTSIRAGRANQNILNGLTFEYYGVETPINQAATISIPEARLLTIKPWDKNNIKAIEKAILKSDIGITPSNDGETIRLPFPQLTEERRKELVKEVNKYSEESKISLRNHRRDAMDIVKKQVKNAELSEDQKIGAEEDIQKTIDKYTKEIESIANKKQKELLEM